MGVLKYYTRSEDSPELYMHQEGLDSRLFRKAIRKALVRGTRITKKFSISFSLPFMVDPLEGEAVTKLDSMIAMGTMEP